MSHRRSNIVGCHENSSQHQTTCKQVSQRRCVSNRINQMHQPGKYKYCHQNRYRNMPGNNLFPIAYIPDQAIKPMHSPHLVNPGYYPEIRLNVSATDLSICITLYSHFHQCQRSSTGFSIGITSPLLNQRP